MLPQIVNHLETTGKFWIAFTGDSIASCEWVHPNWRDIVIYVLHDKITQELQGNWQLAEWGIKGFNFAYDGATTKDIVEHLDDLLSIKPQLVIGLMGGNDPVLDVSVQESTTNITTIVDQVLNSGSKIVWANSTPAGKESSKNLEYQPYAQAFMEIGDKEGFQKIDMFNLYKSFPIDKFFTFLSEENPVECLQAGDPDLQHPNQLGNAYIAKVILKEVFEIEFDPDKYIQETLAGVKLPSY